MKRWDGSIQASNTPTYDKVGISREDYGMYRCMVTEVIYVDDPKNITKNAKNPEVLYSVVILGGSASGQKLSYCRMAAYLGGDSNYGERILIKTSKDISKIKLADQDGDIVYVQFNQGHDAYPVIIGLAKGLNNKIGATKADGPRLIESYNGLIRNINNKGELITTMMGGKVTDGKFTANKESLIKDSWLSTEMFSRTYKSGLKFEEDGKNDKVTQTFKSGLTVTHDGKGDKAEIKTAGGVTATIDGKGNKVILKAGSTEVIIDGSSGKITLKGEMIDLGSAVADFVTQFTQLATAFVTHQHPNGNLGTPTGFPMAPLLISVGSQTVKVQA